MINDVLLEDAKEGIFLLILLAALCIALRWALSEAWKDFKRWLRERKRRHDEDMARMQEVDELYQRCYTCLAAIKREKQSEGDLDEELPPDVQIRSKAIQDIYEIANDLARWQGDLIEE